MLILISLALNFSTSNSSFADSDPFPGVATGAEIPGTKIWSQPGVTQSQWESTDLYKSFSCPSGAGSGMGVDLNFTPTNSDDRYFAYCVKTWRPTEDINADAAFRAAQDAAIAAATAESQAWNAANPGRQKCVQWGPIVHANGVSTASGGVCANPVPAGSGTTVPSQQTDSVVGPSTAPSTSTSTTPAAIPTNETPIIGNGSPYTKLLPGQLSTDQCPVGFQAANGIIVAIGTGTFTECWPDLAWKANRLGGTYWEQFNSSGGTYDVTPVLDALQVIADYKARAKAVAQTAADLTPGVQRCSTWSVYGQTSEECAYTFIQPSGVVPRTDSTTATTTSDTSTVSNSPAIDTSTAQSLNTNNLDSSTATVALVPVAGLANPVSNTSPTNTSETSTAQNSQSTDLAQAPLTFEPVAADITAKQLKGRIVITVETNLENSALTVTATKKGAKSIVIPLITNSEGDKKLIQNFNLSGYTLTLKSGTQILDKVKMK